jgi:hypothetical protein
VSLVSGDWRLARAARREPAIALPLWPALWSIVLAGALWLRVGALDATPLAPDEAARALEGRAIWRGEAIEYADGPLLPNLLSVWFGLFTAADGPARAPSALAGWAICLSPLLFRSRLSGAGILGSCTVLAVSPVGVLAGRSVDPASFAVLGTTATMGCVILALERADGRWLVVSAAATAMALAASPASIGQLAAAALAMAFCPPIDKPRSLKLRLWAPRAVLGALAAAVVLDTLLLTRPPGLQSGLVDPFAAWLGSIGPSRSTFFGAGVLGLHEVLLLALAAVGLAGVVRTTFGRFLASWALASIALALVHRAPDLAVLLGPSVPLALLGGLGITRLGWMRWARPAVWLTGLSTLVPVTFFVVASHNSLQRGAAPSWAALAIALAALVAFALIASTWIEPSEVWMALGLAIALGLVALHVSFLTRLNYTGFERGGPALLGQSSHPDLRRVEEQARDWWRQDPMSPIWVDASLREHLEWSLRDGPPVEWISTAPARPQRAILGGDTASGRPEGAWLRLVVAERYTPRAETTSPLAFWRWIVRRSASDELVRVEPRAILVSQQAPAERPAAPWAPTGASNGPG